MKGLYIHIPFCVRKCRYCDFPSYAGMEDYIDNYISAVEKEAKEYIGEAIDTVFIGGGTPTVMNNAQIERLMADVYNSFNVSRHAEITIEANPGTVSCEKLDVIKACGINRVSIGVQSFCDEELQLLGRIHNSEQAAECVKQVSERFENFSLDIMTALPEQNMKRLMKTIDTAISFAPKHISCYSLIIEEGTPFYDDYSDGSGLPGDDADCEMYDKLCERLAENGYRRYEISNFARDGYSCRHNIKYWQCREYIGIGAAAHSYNNGSRYSNTNDIGEYIKGNRRKDIEVLSEKDRISEFMMLGFRMTEGVSENEFLKRFRKTIDDVYSSELEKFISCGMIIRENGRCHLSGRGLEVSNSIMAEFML